MVVAVRQYLARDGKNPFGRWFDRLDVAAAVRVTTAIARMGEGNFSNVKGVGAGVFECRLHTGPGYRIYFGKDGDAIIILLGGGTKQRQDRDIAEARERWADYQRRK